MATSLGFLSIRQHSEHGYFGGYLVVNHLGRPLEFHCTLPVKPTRAQVLLYGPTMDDFVCGEQIAKALIAKAKLNPKLVITDTPAALSAALVSDVTIVWLVDPAEQTENQYLRFPAHTNLATRQFAVTGHKFWSLKDCQNAEATVAEVLPQLSERFDITEPFTRIVEALFEAHPIIKAAA
jgi:hypothetical protein